MSKIVWSSWTWEDKMKNKLETCQHSFSAIVFFAYSRNLVIENKTGVNNNLAKKLIINLRAFTLNKMVNWWIKLINECNS